MIRFVLYTIVIYFVMGTVRLLLSASRLGRRSGVGKRAEPKRPRRFDTSARDVADADYEDIDEEQGDAGTCI